MDGKHPGQPSLEHRRTVSIRVHRRERQDVRRPSIHTEPPDPYLAMTAAHRLELGCGRSKVHPDSIGVDVLDLPGVDLVGPVPEVLASIDDASIDVVYSNHFLEHVESVEAVMRECARVLRPGGTFIAVVPHFSNPYYYSDPTHRSPFGLYSMSYFADDPIHARAVPKYVTSDDQIHFRIRSAHLHFDRSLRRPLSFVIGRSIEAAATRSRHLREFYERRLAWSFPCHEIRFELERV